MKVSLQLYVNGQQVELFEDESITLTQSIQDVRDIAKIFTEFTRQFSVPASKNNNRVFQHFYNQDIIDGIDARMVMIFDGRWKYVHVENMPPILFDLESDPQELVDLGRNEIFADQIYRLRDLHFKWARQHHTRITLNPENVDRMAKNKEPPGILIGFWDQNELENEGKSLPTHLR